MLNPVGLDPKAMQALRHVEAVPTLDEQALKSQGKRHPVPWYNTFVSLILRSSLHWLLSGSVMLISVRGRKSGRMVTTPVNYVSAHGGVLYTVSDRKRMWWRNFEGGAPIRVRVRGQDRSAFGTVLVEPQVVARELGKLVYRVPRYAAALQIKWTEGGEPDIADLERAAQNHVLVSIRLD